MCIVAGKYSKLAIVEEEQCDDLLLFVELLDHHTAILEEVGDQLIPESKEQLAAVLVDGVCLLLSFVNEELLKVCTSTVTEVFLLMLPLFHFNFYSFRLSVRKSSLCSITSAQFLQQSLPLSPVMHCSPL